MKIRPVGAELFHADRRKEGRTDRQTDRTKLIVRFRNFANAPNECPSNIYLHISLQNPELSGAVITNNSRSLSHTQFSAHSAVLRVKRVTRSTKTFISAYVKIAQPSQYWKGKSYWNTHTHTSTHTHTHMHK